ncbi:rap guanine nucleotide exchange factor 2-like isoform X1 [Tigriopus californicus]|uniref:rap guanine nucleotide exchange factor 2-like isoform X1 n=2 Tax=Tigriopus californicus TaxID=6832 RepID=UPI0027DA1C80|nr:rap guanine nucleotide exchange factor 2-like isoform X1 [Tigriopus californicus]XP_059092788.1 rap guanine nucleotide exchange factor 2-like isoform X1 [Tigriopus californicus]
MIEHNSLVSSMMSYSEQQFIHSLRKEPDKRSIQELQVIYAHLASIEALSKLRESALRSLCTMVRYERHCANDILYCRGELASCWYILLCGAVFIDGQMFLPRSSFGKRIGGAARRHNECLILEPSEMIVIDYVDGRARTERISDASGSTMMMHSPNGPSSKAITEVTIQPHGGTFVDSSSSSTSSDIASSDDHPPPPPPRNHHLLQGSQYQMHQQQNQHQLHHHITNGHIHHTKPPVSYPHHGSQHIVHHNESTTIYHKAMRNSHSSDSSSAYSGSDTMQSVPSSGEGAEEVDLTGLMESVVDSDEEEDISETSLVVRDAVRECLEKDPNDRTEEDVDTLLEFTQHLKAFTNMTMYVRRALVATMVFAVVEKAGTVVMTDGEELDSWSVIINGHVEIEESNGKVRELHLGDSFGIKPTMDKLYHRGVMRTKCDDCQFVCITQTDYYRILHQGEENQKRHEENGRVVLVTEKRQVGDVEPQRRGHVVIRGSCEKLMGQLMEDNSDMDPTFTEDFLLTYRTFLGSPVIIMKQLVKWFEESHLRDKVTRVLLLWVNNHFTDFETDPQMMEYLEKFENCLEAEKMQGQLRMLNFACAAKARKRTVTLTRPSRDEPLQFSTLGGYERGSGIFISRVEKGSKADEIGLKRGDQILEVNGQSFEHVTKHARALEILKGVCHLSITVKSNLLAFNEMLQAPDDSTPRSRARGKSVGSTNQTNCPNAGGVGVGGGGSSLSGCGASSTASKHDPHLHARAMLSEQSTYSGSEGTLSFPAHHSFAMDTRSQVSNNTVVSGPSTKEGTSRDTTPTSRKKKDGGHVGSHSNGTGPAKPSGGSSSIKQSRINRAFNRFLHKPKSLMNMDSAGNDEFLGSAQNGNRTSLSPSGVPNALSNPDLRDFERPAHQDHKSEYPEHVLKVYRADQTFKYLLVHKETTAHEVVMLSLQEFGSTEPSSNYTLCEVSVAEGGFVKQRRLPEALQNLAERIGLASRYYIKNIHSSESLLPDEVVADLVKEVHVTLLQLNPVEVSTQLMVEDFTIFRQIEATEYVEDLFEIKSRYGTPSLSLFAELVNREMMWAISEIVSEPNATKRMRIIKQYIKVARQCKETQNFNSMFAIISGLGHGAVSRLKSSWEKLPTKYQRMFNEMQQLMDPSRNMSRYRNLVTGEDVQPPIIPFYPVVKKDLTFINLANDSKIEELVNFEKLRMIAKEVRALTNMCSAPLDLFSMLELGGQQPSNAMVAMNQLTAGGQYLATVNRNRRKKNGGVPNPKRMYEEAQMVRRVKAYLNNMKVITNEEKLHQMSLECEPPSGGGILSNSSMQQSVRKRNPSPSPSALSSNSSASHGSNVNNHSSVERKVSPNGGIGSGHLANNSPVHPKFGSASPQAVKKLLALSEQSRTRPKSHMGVPSPMASRKPGASQGPLSGTQHFGSSSQNPVDLTAESSSVTSLPVLRKATTGSITSTDSGLGIYDPQSLKHHGSHEPSSDLIRHHHSQSSSASPRIGQTRRQSTHHRKPRISPNLHQLHQHHSFDFSLINASASATNPVSSLNHNHGRTSPNPGQIPPSSPPPPIGPPPLHIRNPFTTRMIGGKGMHLPPPRPPPKTQRGTVPSYYVTDPDEEEDAHDAEDEDEDEETQVSAV